MQVSQPRSARLLWTVRAGARRRRSSDDGAAAAFIAAPLALYCLVVVYPALSTIYLSFQEWNGLGAARWVGLANYIHLFAADHNFRRALVNTALWTVLFVPTTLGIGLCMANIVNSRIPGRMVFRVLFYLPFVLSSVSVGLIWKWVYYPEIGALDITLRALGLPTLGWLSDPAVALYAVVAAAVWQAAGGSMVIFMAGLQTIPGELYEAAALDGAGMFAMMRHITLPGLRESVVVAGSLAVLGSLNVFDLVYTTTLGGPANSTQVLGTWMYFQSFEFGRFGAGSAIACVLLAIVATIAVPFITRTARGQLE